MQSSHAASATGHQIREILGPVDEEVVRDILASGATTQEISEAFAWLNDDYVGTRLKKGMSERVRRVYEILQEDREGIFSEEH